MLAQLFDVLALFLDFLLEEWVEVSLSSSVVHAVVHRTTLSLLLLKLILHALSLRCLIHNLLQLLESTSFVELASFDFNTCLKLCDVFNESLISGHDKDAILGMFSLLTLQLVMKSINRFLQELHLYFVLLLNVVILDYNLLVVTLNVALKLLQYAHLQLLIVINALSDPVNRILECADCAVIHADLGSGLMNSLLHLLLFQTKVLDQEA